MTVLQSSRSTTNKVLDYPLNAWYATAWDHEVTRKPMARRIAGRPLALYRTEDFLEGRAAEAEGRPPVYVGR